MTEIIDLASYRPPPPSDPHMAGPARCMECKHDWQAAAPVGTVTLECPSCGTFKGAWRGAINPAPGTPIWKCVCGNDLFTLLLAGPPMCGRCGLRATSWAE